MSETRGRQGGMRGGPGGHGFGAPVQKAKNFKGTLKRLLAFLKPQRVKLIVVLILAIASTIFSIAAPKVTGQAINKLKDGFVAKTVIQQMIPVQEKAVDQINSMLDADVPLEPEVKSKLESIRSLPVLSEAADGETKAQIIEQLLQLSNVMPQSDGTLENPVKFTEDQMRDSIRAVRETNGRIDFDFIGQIAVILLIMYFTSAGFSLATGLVMSGVAQRTVFDLRKRVDEKLEHLPLGYFDKRTHGEVLSRMTNDVDTISTTLQQSLTQLITAVVQLIGFIAMMLSISVSLTAIVLITMPLYIFSTMFVAKRSQKYFAAQQKSLGKLSGHVEEMYSGHKIVRAFGQENKSIQQFRDVNDDLYESGWKAQFVSGILFPMMNFISNLGYVFIAVVGGIWMTRSLLNLGDVAAFIQYSRSFTQPIIQTANIANVVQSTIACAERVFEVLDEEEEINVETEPTRKVSTDMDWSRATCGAVRLENISFRYVDAEPLIEEMSLSVEPGHTVAIVGPTGAGKTTLVNLLMRFYELKSGRITIDGKDIVEMSRENLRSRFGMVLQDTWLFNGTIRDNIAYGRSGASEDEIIEAAVAAHADHFIRTLPEGYETILNEEASNLSQGQKQLLTIARAILSNPAILILDEATSSVDTRTEHLIQKAMKHLMANRTSFVIAHRLSTIREAEVILVMNHGKIVEIGTHDALLEKSGFYADLYQSQFAGAVSTSIA